MTKPETLAHTTAIDRLRDVVKHFYGCAAFHWRTARVCHVLRDQIIFNHQVEVFKLKDHPKAEFCYAWAYEGESGETHYIALLDMPPVTSPERAVRLALAKLVTNERA